MKIIPKKGIQKERVREMTVKKISRCNSCGKFFDSKRELRTHRQDSQNNGFKDI